MKVGFIGLGNMGMPMCTNLIEAGHDVRVFDVRPEARQACAKVGAREAESAAAAASEANVVMTSLPRPSDVEAVALGSDGIIGCAHAIQIFGAGLMGNAQSVPQSRLQQAHRFWHHIRQNTCALAATNDDQ